MAACDLLDALRSGSVPSYVRRLPKFPEAVPASLLALMTNANADAVDLSQVLHAEVVAPPEALLPYLSGPLGSMVKPKQHVATFFAELFHHIAAHSEAGISLCGYDLYHAHLLLLDGDVGLLFHAKEHPKEYTLSSRQLHPIASMAAGGERDPRQGTTHSIRDRSFAQRNVLWLCSTNDLYLFLPDDASFPSTDLLSEFAGYHFATLDESAFSPAARHAPSVSSALPCATCGTGQRSPTILDVNYLSKLNATRPATEVRPEHVLCAVFSPYDAALIAGRGQVGNGLAPSTAPPTATRAVVDEPQGTPDNNSQLPWPPSQPRMTGNEPTPQELAEQAAVRRAQRRAHQCDASLRFERLLRGRPPPSETPSGHWVVLIGGEYGGVMVQDAARTRPGSWLGSHTSLQAIGRAFEVLLPTVGRDRIIVVAQLRETLRWLEEACRDDESCARVAGSARFLPTLRRRLGDTRRDCAVLLAHGGADYDFEDVNAATALHVLSGDAAATGGRPVVPRRATSVLVLLNSHGNAHPRLADHPDECLDEHYMHFPHPVPVEAEGLYDGVAYAGDKAGDSLVPFGPRKHRWRLYSTMLFQALLRSFCARPHRQIVVLNQSCLSAGHARFLQHEPYQKAFNTRAWPISLVSTAGPYEASIADFWDAYLREWAAAISVPAARRTLGQVLAAAEARYYAANRGMQAHNAAVAAETRPAHLPLSFGTIHMHEGQGKGGGAMSDTAIWDLLVEEEEAEEDEERSGVEEDLVDKDEEPQAIRRA